MNTKLKIALGLAFTAITFTANAQKTYTDGIATISMGMMGQSIEAKNYFSQDSTAIMFSAGPASIKVLTSNKGTFMATLVDVPAAAIKKVAIATPDEIDQELAKIPALTFTPTTETKVINGFNCKKVIATDTKTSKTYDFWVTNDVSLPKTMMSKIYDKAGGVPIQYYSFRDGQSSEITVKSIVEGKAPAGTFSVSKDYEKITMDDLKAMSGR